MDPNKVFKRGKAFKKEGKHAIVFFMCKICSRAITIRKDSISKERLGLVERLSLIECRNCRIVGSWKRI